MKHCRLFKSDSMRNPGTLTLLLILASVITAVVIFGCGQDQDPIVLGSHNLPNVADNVEITGKVMTIDNGTSYATITSNDAGYLITCGDFNVQLKDIADKSDSIFLGFTEWTGSDTLDVIIEWVGYRHQFETYTLNGQVLFMEITDNITDEQFEQLSSFLNDPAKVNTITGNEDGYVMSALINDNWDEIINEISKPDKRTEFGDMICPLAEACVATKCWFGALLNPWCGGCTSIVIACNLMDAFGWW